MRLVLRVGRGLLHDDAALLLESLHLERLLGRLDVLLLSLQLIAHLCRLQILSIHLCMVDRLAWSGLVLALERVQERLDLRAGVHLESARTRGEVARHGWMEMGGGEEDDGAVV